MVPNGWVEGKIKSLVKSLDAGVSVNSEDDGNLNSEFKILKTSCVSGDSFDPTKVKSVVKQNEIERLKEPVLSDSIIISRMNTPALVGANGYVEHEIANTYLPDRLWQLKPHKDKVCMRWLGYWFASSPTRHKLGSTATGTSGSMKNITKADVLNISINIPPLPEQQKIATILTTWDKAIDTTERLIDNSKQHKKALMQQLLTGKKRLLDDNGKPFEGEWDKVNLSKVVKVTGGNAFKSAEFIKVGVPLVKISNIKPDYSVNVDTSVFVEYSQKHNRFEIKRGDILIAMSGATTGKVGKYEFDELAYLNQRVGRFDVKKSIIKDYLFQLLKLPKIQHNILIDAVGGAQPNISNKDIERIKVSLPSLEEQQKIAAVLTNADKEVELLEQQLADLQQEKKALMQVLLTGKKRVVVDG